MCLLCEIIKSHNITLPQILDMKRSRTYPIIVVGNKTDLEDRREIPRAQVERTVRDAWKIPHIETSAKEDHNVGELFKRVLRMISTFQSQQQIERRKKQSRGSGNSCCVLL